MDRTIHRSGSRGKSDLGWLQSRFSFSFANHFDPSRERFGVLRVFNDDVVQPLSGFGMHSHRDMEIVTVMLGGVLTHEDSLGNKLDLRAGEVQVMHAGTGIMHSEMNHGRQEPAALLQIWVFPDRGGHAPGHAQMSYDPAERMGRWQVLASGREAWPSPLRIHQDAAFLRAELLPGEPLRHDPGEGRWVHLFVISGEVELDGQAMGKGDFLEAKDGEPLDLLSAGGADVLLINLPPV